MTIERHIGRCHNCVYYRGTGSPTYYNCNYYRMSFRVISEEHLKRVSCPHWTYGDPGYELDRALGISVGEP